MRPKVKLFTCLATTALAGFFSICAAVEAQEESKPRVGFIGCLSSFAANYGNAALEGAQLAVEEAKRNGSKVELFVEDDRSEMKNTALSYRKLKDHNKIQGLLGGSWWANSIVSVTAAEKVPFVSVETLYEKDTQLAPNYFLLQGDLKAWIRAFEGVVRSRQFKTAATLRFSSGFGGTLAEAMEELFSVDSRKYLGTVEYSDIHGSEAQTLALRLKTMNPDVIYVDAQPSSIPVFIKRIREVGLTKTVIFTNDVVQDSIRLGALSTEMTAGIIFSRRAIIGDKFAARFREKYGREPILNSDLGYYGARLLIEALGRENPIEVIKGGGITVDGVRFTFDDKNLFTGLRFSAWEFVGGEVKEVL